MVLSRVPIRLRLTLWYVLLLATLLAAFSASVYLLMRHALYQNLDNSIRNRADALLEVVQYEGARPFLPGQGSQGDPGQEGPYARVIDSSGGPEFEDASAPGHVPIDAEAVASALQGRSVTRRVNIKGDDDAPTGDGVPHSAGR